MKKSRLILFTQIFFLWSCGSDCPKAVRIQSNNGEYLLKEYHVSCNDSSIKEGPFVEYSSVGSKLQSGNYKNDLKDGKWSYYNFKGELFLEENYSDGQKHGERTYYHQGQAITKYHFEYGKLMNCEFSIDQNGNELDLGTLYNGNGTLNIYNELGELISTGTFKDGRKNGLWKNYYEDFGRLKSKGEFKNGKKLGIWINYELVGDSTMITY